MDSLFALLDEAVSGNISVDLLIAKLNDYQRDADFIDSLADIIVQLDNETCIVNIDRRDTLLTITKEIIDRGILPVNVAAERFDIESFQDFGLVPDKKIVKTTHNRIRTKLFFKQRKFNLLREESEGFAKLLVLLSQMTHDNMQQTLTTIIETIGFYKVDPNRVLDLALEALEFNCRSDNELYIKFIVEFYNSSTKLTNLVALKLSFYSVFSEEAEVLTPESLYRTIALLIHHDIVNIDDIYPFLLPTDSKILDFHKRLASEAKEHSKKYGMAMVGEEKPTKSVTESLSPEERHFFLRDNQKLNLCAHLMKIGDWDKAMEMARKLPEFYCLSYARCASAACNLIEYHIDPLYRQVGLPSPLNSKISQRQEKLGKPQVKSIDEFQTCIFPMLHALGPFLSSSTLAFTKIVRVLKYIIEQKEDPLAPDTPLYNKILDIVNDSILPSLALTSGNPCLSRVVWSLVRNFGYHIRYKLYYNWKDEGSNPIMLHSRGDALLKAKHYMKRLSKDSLRQISRQLGKLCYSNPVIILNYVLLQIQSYDNLIPLVVESLKFLPDIALDVLVYCILESLSDPHKNKKSIDGLALAPWLTSLSSFAANVIFYHRVEFKGYLDYISNQLKAGSSLDLVLLTDLIQKMTGIETIQNITDDKIEALSGGDILRTECAYFGQVKNTKKSSARLKEALVESGLAMQLCISIAQLRDSLFFYRKDGTPLKLLGKLYDQCQETLVQYGVFLSMNLSINDYINLLPSLETLMTEYKLDPDSAFYLARPMIFHKINSKFGELQSQLVQSMKQDDGGEEGEELKPSCQNLMIKFVDAVRSVIDPLAVSIEQALLEKYGAKNLNAKLFVIFWTLSLGDLEVPTACYEREIQRLKNLVNESRKLADEDRDRRKERDRINNLIQKLKSEKEHRKDQVKYIRVYLESERKNLFSDKSNFDSVYLESRQFVQHCPYARSVLTAHDAIYSARFLLELHDLRVENYPTIICLDRLLCDITYMMGACTENEASHYGRFLCTILKTATLWHSDAEIHREQCELLPGSIINLEISEHITFENYRDICYKWHYRLTRAFTSALDSNNYVEIRNALIVMTSVIDYYPQIKHFGKGIGRKIEEVRNNEKDNRQDLYARATAYAGKLDDKKPSLIPESEFHIIERPIKKS